MEIKILKFRPYEKNTLQGFLDVLLPSGLEIHDMTYHVKGDRRWIGYPARQYEDENGDTAYANIVFVPDKNRHNVFQRALLTAFDAYE
jgi:hypothetical protein